MTLADYLSDPCRHASLPWYKARQLSLPDGMQVVHDSRFDPDLLSAYDDETYFRLFHDLRGLTAPEIPAAFRLTGASAEEFAAHIHACYGGGPSADSLAADMRSAAWHPDLWIVLRNEQDGSIAASGIAALDPESGEGSLEWIQVSAEYRRQGLGRCIVRELLLRMQELARFATVSGKCVDPSCPELLYRACGFTGQDVWHILRQKA